ncbi:helix-turn-helix transcriptional regulator [Streptomyces sp. XD-27]|uniref:ArsR/SmtB family transcription factor n=1 Tax=Streptomyces sp. XD-27 TaxID=3062779 RepID=UPI0026F45089|nr:winged helix-turn-helix domain-containing protein [Streptomyces sp. XD-27]WKX74029.1 winged helix-turn-helix domain-containing protein [Streptomyces sp. XD-27]
MSEAVFALHRFGRDRARSGIGWHKFVRERLGDDLPAIDEVVSEYRVVPDLLWLLERDGTDADSVPSAVRARARRLAQVVFLFCSAGILPYWSRMQARLEIERDMRGRMAITNGVEFLLAGLHPKVTWESSELRIASSFDLDIKLDGRGLTLSPSLFLPDKTCVLVRSERQSGVPALVFSTPLDLNDLESLPEESEDEGDRALAALVGATRAAALRALSESGTTGDLSDRLGISLSGASKQATVLREAGLITTLRNRTTAMHTLTPLGLALLQRKLPAELTRLLGNPGGPGNPRVGELRGSPRPRS